MWGQSGPVAVSTGVPAAAAGAPGAPGTSAALPAAASYSLQAQALAAAAENVPRPAMPGVLMHSDRQVRAWWAAARRPALLVLCVTLPVHSSCLHLIDVIAYAGVCGERGGPRSRVSVVACSQPTAAPAPAHSHDLARPVAAVCCRPGSYCCVCCLHGTTSNAGPRT
jgi:hypothetical protein